LGSNAVVAKGVEKKLAVPFHVEGHPALGQGHDHCCFFYVCKARDMTTFKPDKRMIEDHGWFAFPEIRTCPATDHVKNVTMNAFASYAMVPNK